MSLLIGPRWLKLRIGGRGARVSVGPRPFRLHGVDRGTLLPPPA